MNEQVKLRPLGKLLNLIESNGFKVEYQHDDLVFIDNTAFIFRFDETDAELLHLHFNVDCAPEAKEKLTAILLKSAKKEKLTLVISGDFELKNIEDREEFQLIFK